VNRLDSDAVDTDWYPVYGFKKGDENEDRGVLSEIKKRLARILVFLPSSHMFICTFSQ
jgi:hypothetical protein